MKEYFKIIYKDGEEEYKKRLIKLLKSNQKQFIITANPETLMIATKDPEINKMLKDKTIDVIPDGIGIVKAAKKLGYHYKTRITGCDVAEFLLQKAAETNKKVYLFGATQEVIDKMQEVIAQKYKGAELIGCSNGYVEDRDKVMKEIIALKPDICFVALGIPYQEKLIYKYINNFKKGIFIGVGGSLDVISGNKKRAPKIFIKLNIEWLYRILKEPKRLKRFYDNNVKFLIKIKK